MKRIVSLLVTSAAFSLCSCQSTVKSDIKSECCAKPGAACCKPGAACCKTAPAKTTECASCAAGAKHKH